MSRIWYVWGFTTGVVWGSTGGSGRGCRAYIKVPLWHLRLAQRSQIEYRHDKTHSRQILGGITALLIFQSPDLGADVELAIDPDILGHDAALLGELHEGLEAGHVADGSSILIRNLESHGGLVSMDVEH